MHRNNRRTSIRVQCDSVVQLEKKAVFFETGRWFCAAFCPASACPSDSVAWGFLLFGEMGAVPGRRPIYGRSYNRALTGASRM